MSSMNRQTGFFLLVLLNSRDLPATGFPQGTLDLAAENLLVGRGKACYVWPAFVALVTPLDSFEGAASSNLRPLSLYGWRRSRSTNSLKKKSEYISERTRNSEVVQCQQGIRVHPAPVRRGCFRSLLRDSSGGLQVAERRPG